MPLISLYSAPDRVLKGRVQKSTVLHEDVVSSRSYFNTSARVCDSLFGVSVGKCAHEAMVLVFLAASGCRGAWDSIACWEPAEVGEVVTIPCPRALRTMFGRNGRKCINSQLMMSC